MKFLLIQTAFIGDVILATSVAEKLHQSYPEATIHFVVRKGNESLLINHPFIHKVFVWDKKENKIANLFSLISQVKKEKYDYCINLHRFSSSGFITVFSDAKTTIGFDKNPLSFFFSKKYKHIIGNGTHEVERNHQLIAELTDTHFARPRLYPSTTDFEKTIQYKKQKYICIAPTSVWFTKQFPIAKWIEFVKLVDEKMMVYLLGAPSDFETCQTIISDSKRTSIVNLCGKLSLLESAALMRDADMNYVNDSAPMHLCSAMNAPVTAVFCSTIPDFGFGPLSDNSNIVQTELKLECRPCGLHGFKACPLGHFNCAQSISVEQLQTNNKV